MTTPTCSQGYSWCQGGSPDCCGDHSSMVYQRASLGEGALYRLDDDDEPLMIGTGVSFNVRDGAAGVSITVHVQGGPNELDVQVDLRVNEAYEFSRLLDAALIDATSAALSLLPPRLANDLLEVGS